MTELEIRGRATIGRYVDYLKNTVGIPIRYDDKVRRYVVDKDGSDGETGLLGLWFTPSELHALLAMHQLLRRIEPGVLRSHVEPLRERLNKILGAQAHSVAEIERRVKVLPMSARPVDAKVYQDSLTALLHRKRMAISYVARGSREGSTRAVSPQRLVYYRDNWYLDAWCHKRGGLRMFALDGIGTTQMLSEAARDVPEEYLKAVLEAGYGIFSGRRTRMARLRFSASQARWMSTEVWHPKQVGKWDRKGNYLLQFPFSSDPELVMDLLRHIPEVEVLGPKSLRMHLNSRIKAAAAKLQ